MFKTACQPTTYCHLTEKESSNHGGIRILSKLKIVCVNLYLHKLFSVLI